MGEAKTDDTKTAQALFRPRRRPTKAQIAERARIERAFEAQYHPPRTGLHIVGIDDDGEREVGPHFTIRAITMPPAEAMAVFARLRPIYEDPDTEAWDVLVDLHVAGSHTVEDNFGMRRQMVEVLEREIARAAP